MLKVLTTLASVVVTLAYPFVVYLGLQAWGSRTLGLALLGLLAVITALKLSGARTTRDALRTHWRSLVGPPAAAGSLLALSAIIGHPLLILLVPILINVSLLVMFASSLRSPVSFIERFARLQEPELSPEKVRYCRSVTKVWCGFFVANALATGVLALFAPISWWSLYCGAIAYTLMGGLFAVEYVVRKAKFRTYNRLPHDRVLALVFPPRTDEPKANATDRTRA